MRMSLHPQDAAHCAAHAFDPNAVPLAVVDTNVVLDLWWFGDPHAAALAQALEHGTLRLCVTDAMRAELIDVLGRPAFSEDEVACKLALASFDRLARWVPHRSPEEVPEEAPACSDPDDQLFIDQAISCGARWLITRDNALLVLAPSARRWGCSVVTPQQWAASVGAGQRSTSGACPAP
jgi:predicted nucleic acid-binding protein